MGTYQTQARYFKILMHPSRLAILDILRYGEQCVCHMEAALGLRQAHISQHLMVLRKAGLVADRRQGWNIYYRVIKPDIYRIIDAAVEFCGLEKDNPEPALPILQMCACPKCKSGSENTHFVALPNTSAQV